MSFTSPKSESDQRSPKILKYDLFLYPFALRIRSHFLWGGPLDQLHNWSSEPFPLVEGQAFDQASPVHKHFYTIFAADDKFLALYRRFIKEFVWPHYGVDIVYQAKPSFRIHYPDNLAVGEFHRDSEYNHPLAEDNWWLPFTAAYDNNTIWMESEKDLGDYMPRIVSPGEVLVFPGGILRHGNKINDTGVSRVSIDFRVMRRIDYSTSDAKSVNKKLSFKLGEYYEAFP